MKQIFSCAILFLIGCASGVQQGNVRNSKPLITVPTSWYADPLPKTAEANAFASDLDLMEGVFANAYVGFEVAKKHGFQWEHFFSDWRASLQKFPVGAQQINSMLDPFWQLQDFQNDNFTQLQFDGAPFLLRSKGSVTAYLEKAPEARSCSGLVQTSGKLIALNTQDLAQQPKTALMRVDDGSLIKVNFLSFPRRFLPVRAIKCGEETLPLSLSWSPSLPESLDAKSAKQQSILDLVDPNRKMDSMIAMTYPSFREISRDLGYLRIPSLATDPSLIKKYLQIPQNTSAKKMIIVDLRANAGGFKQDSVKVFLEQISSIPKLKLALQPLLENKDTLPIIRKHSCLDADFAWTEQQQSSQPNKELDQEGQHQVRGGLDDLTSTGAQDCQIKFSKGDRKWFYPLHRFIPRPDRLPIFLVLVDNLCSNDCEAMLYHLAKLYSSLILGVNTFGDVQFQEARSFILPKTRIRVAMATAFYDFYGDKRSVDNYGLDVDILLPTEGSQQADSILSVARKILTDPKIH